MSSVKKLYRSEDDVVIAGVSAGIAEYFEIDPVIVRLFFVAITLLGGSGIILYFILWLIVPAKSDISKSQKEVVEKNSKDFEKKVNKFAESFSHSGNDSDGRIIWGGILVIAGVIFLLGNMGFGHIFNIARLWPLVLIFIGVMVLFKSGKN